MNIRQPQFKVARRFGLESKVRAATSATKARLDRRRAGRAGEPRGALRRFKRHTKTGAPTSFFCSSSAPLVVNPAASFNIQLGMKLGLGRDSGIKVVH